MNHYWVYMLTNKCDSAIYIGVTNDLERRLSEHRAGKADSHTKRYKHFKLVYQETYGHIDDALTREKQLKGWRRQRKRELIGAMNPERRDLSLDWYSASVPSLRSG